MFYTLFASRLFSRPRATPPQAPEQMGQLLRAPPRFPFDVVHVQPLPKVLRSELPETGVGRLPFHPFRQRPAASSRSYPTAATLRPPQTLASQPQYVQKVAKTREAQ